MSSFPDFSTMPCPDALTSSTEDSIAQEWLPRTTPRVSQLSRPIARLILPMQSILAVFPASRLLSVVPTRRCTPSDLGQFDSTPVSRPPKHRMHSIEKIWQLDKEDFPSRSTLQRTGVTIRTTQGFTGMSVWRGLRSIAFSICKSFSTESHSIR